MLHYRRKFRSQNSDNMDRWKSRDGKSQRGEEEKKEDQKRESLRRKKMQAREKVEKSRNTVFFQWFVAPEGRKVGSLKWRVKAMWSDERWKVARRCGAKHISKSKCTKHTNAEPLLEVNMSKKCTPLRREAHFQVKMYKTPQCRTAFGSWHVEKVHAVVARSTFRSQKCKKTDGFGALLDVQMSFRVAGAWDCAPCQKWAKREGFVAVPKTMAGVGHLKRICKDAFSVAGAVQGTCSSETLGGPGADCRRGVAFWSIRSSVLGRWFRVTGAALRMTWQHHFSWQAQYYRQMDWKIAKRICTRPSALHSTFHFWRTSRRIASFLMLSTSKIEEVSQNRFVFAFVKFKN